MQGVSKLSVLAKVSTLRAGSFNPGIRTQPEHMVDLIKSMGSRGFLPEFPIIVGSDRVTIGDGHRRFHAAKHLGILEVPVIYSQYTAAQVFAMQFDGRRAIKTEELLDASTRGISVEDMPAYFKQRYAQVIKFCGEPAVRYLVDRNLSPSKVNYVSLIANYFKRTINITHTPVYGMRVLTWLVENNTAYAVRLYVSAAKDPTYLKYVIDHNLPLERHFN